MINLKLYNFWNICKNDKESLYNKLYKIEKKNK